MGDHSHNRHGTRGEGCCAPFAGELGHRLTQCGLGQGLLPYQVASSSIQPFGHNRHDQKLGAMPLLGGGLQPHLTQCRLGWGLHPYQLAFWYIQPSGDNRHGPKIGGCALFGGAGSPCNTMLFGPRPTSVPSGILIHLAVWPQQGWLCPLSGGIALHGKTKNWQACK